MKKHSINKFRKRFWWPAFIIEILLSVAILIYLYVLPFTINWEEHKSEIATYVKDVTGRELVIEGGIEFEAFPSPKFLLEKITIKNAKDGYSENFISASSAEIDISFWKLALGSISVSKITLNDATIELENFYGETPNWKFNLYKFDDEKEKIANSVAKHFNVSGLVLNKAKLFYRSGRKEEPVERTLSLESVDLYAGSVFGPFSASGILISESTGLNFKYNAKIGDLRRDDNKPTEVTLSISSGESEMSLSGNITDIKDVPSLDMKLTASLDRSVGEIGAFLGNDDSVLPDIISNMLYEEVINVSGDFSISKKGAGIKNLSIKSTNMESSGDVYVEFKEKTHEIKVDLDINNLNLDKFLPPGATIFGKSFQGNLDDIGFDIFENNNKKENAVDENIANFLLSGGVSEDMNAAINLRMNNITYNEHSIKKFAIDIRAEGANIKLKKLEVLGLPGETSIKGKELSVKKDLKKKDNFAVNFEILGKESGAFLKWIGAGSAGIKSDKLGKFSINAGVIFSPKEIYIKSLKVNSGDFNLLGKIKLRKQKNFIANAAFKINKLNLDDYINTEVESPKPPVEDAKNQTTEKISEEEEYINSDIAKFDAMRNIDLYFKKLAISFSANEIIYKGVSVKKIAGVFNSGGGVMKLSKLSFNSDEFGNAKGHIILDSRELKPSLDIDMSFDHINNSVFAKLIDLDISDTNAKEDKNSKTNSSGGDVIEPMWSEKKFNFDFFTVFIGNFKFRVKTFDIGKIKMNGIRAEMVLSDDDIKLKSFRAKFFDSKFNANGTIGLIPPSVNVSFDSANSDANKILSTLLGYYSTSGKVSISGSVAMSGYTIKRWIDSLSGGLSIISRAITVSGFDIPLLSRKISTLKDIKNVRYWSHKALSSGKTHINYIAGNALIKDGIISFNNISLTNFNIKNSRISGEINVADWTADILASFFVNGGVGDFPATLKVNGNIDRPFVYWEKKGIERFWETRFFN